MSPSNKITVGNFRNKGKNLLKARGLWDSRRSPRLRPDFGKEKKHKSSWDLVAKFLGNLFKVKMSTCQNKRALAI